MARPAKTEYPDYYHTYISKTQGDDVVKVLEETNTETRNLFKNVDDEKGTYAYAEGKWTLNEVLQHLIDSERVFAYRLMRIARNDKTPLPGFEQDDYVPQGNTKVKRLSDLLVEANVLRNSTLLLVKGLTDEMLAREGIASNWNMSARALGFTISGHERHHMQVIKERYLS